MGNEPRIRLREEARSDVPRGRATPPNPGRRRRERVQRPAGARPLPPLPPRPRRISPRGRTRDGPTGTGFRGGGEIPSPLPFPLRGRGGGEGRARSLSRRRSDRPGKAWFHDDSRTVVTEVDIRSGVCNDTPAEWNRPQNGGRSNVGDRLPPRLRPDTGSRTTLGGASPPGGVSPSPTGLPRAGPPGPRPSRVGGTRGSRFEVRRASVRA